MMTSMYISVVPLILICKFGLAALATCPSKWGSMNDSKPMAASSSYKVAVIINQSLPCTGHIKQWHVKADKKGDVRLCIVRPNPKKSNTFTVICNTTFTAVKGINKIKTSKCCMFQKGDMVAYIAFLDVLVRHATSSPVTIFHLFELNGDVLQLGLKNTQDTAGHYDIVLDIEDYEKSICTKTNLTTAASATKSTTSSLVIEVCKTMSTYVALETSMALQTSMTLDTSMVLKTSIPLNSSMVLKTPMALNTSMVLKTSIFGSSSLVPNATASYQSLNGTSTPAVINGSAACQAKCGNTFSNWGECSKSCGPSFKTRFLLCEIDSDCEDKYKETKSCQMQPCAVDGSWSTWSSWSYCNKSCQVGYQTRNRTCTEPAPADGGYDCIGISNETAQCNFNPCPVHGGLSQWSSWTSCDQPCGGGRSRSTRKCNSPSPAFGGLPCQGAMEKVNRCNNHLCKKVNISIDVKFTNESIKNMSSAEFRSFAAKLESNLRDLYVNSSSVVTSVIVNQPSINETVSFTVVYNQSAADEIIIITNAIEDIGILNTMPVKALKIVSSSVPLPPTLNKTSSVSSTSILVSWSYPNTENVTGFTIFFKIFGSSNWQRITTFDSLKREYLLTDLSEHTLYTLRVSAFTRYANGISSRYSDCYTLQGVPVEAPSQFTCSASSSKSLHLQWTHLKSQSWRGFMAGYLANYTTYDSNEGWKTSRFSSVFNSSEISGLKPFTRYQIYLAGYTGAGAGLFSWNHCKTGESAALRSPSNVAGKLLSRDGRILVTWEMMSSSEAGGIPIGYKVYSKATKRGSEQYANPTQKVVEVSQYANSAFINESSSYTEVEIQVSASTAAGEGPRSSPVYIETCRCPKDIYVVWYPKEPLIYGNTDRPLGVFADFIRNSTYEICKICDGSDDHSFGGVSLFFNKTKDGRRAVFESEEKLKNRVDANAHIFLSIEGKQHIDVFQKDYKFLMLTASYGSVMLTKQKSAISLESRIVSLMVSCWPPLIITLLMAMIFGILVWLTDHKVNPEFSLNSFIKGALSGCWWAVITMTTVGYGDFTPRSTPARIIAITWMLIGPILSSILIGVISTSLTTIEVEKMLKLYGTSVAVKVNSSEYYLAIRRNAHLKKSGILPNNTAVIEALANGRVDAALIDSLSAASIQGTLHQHNIKNAQTFAQVLGYGIVLSSDLIPLEHNLRSNLVSHQHIVNAVMNNYSKAIQTVSSLQLTTSKSLVSDMESTNSSFILVLIASSAAMVAVVVLKITVDLLLRGRTRRKSAAILPKYKMDMHRLEAIETRLTEEYQNSLTNVENMLDEMAIKHDRQVVNWFFINKNLIGVPRWLKVRMLKEEQRIKMEKRLRQGSVEEGPEFAFSEWPGGNNITAEEKLPNAEERLPKNGVSQDERMLKCFPIQEETEAELH